MKTTGCASLKNAENVSCPNIFFQVCFLALGISFLDKLYANLFLHFIAGAFLEIVEKC